MIRRRRGAFGDVEGDEEPEAVERGNGAEDAGRGGEGWAELPRVRARARHRSSAAVVVGRRLGNESVKRKRSSSKEHRFVELVPRPSTACTIEIELANGRRVIVPSTIDAVVLARVLEVVEGRRC